MILFSLFLSLLIGINIRYSIIFGIVEIIALSIFIYFRFGKKITLLALGFTLVGVGLSFIRPSSTRPSYLGIVSEVKDNYFLFTSHFEKMYVYEPNHQREIGDILNIVADKEELNFVVLESEFDFKEYLNNKGIYYELIVKEVEVKFYNPIRLNNIKKNFLEKFDDNSRGIVGGLLFANSDNGDIGTLGRSLHLVRLINVSGVYLYLIYWLIKKIVGFFIKKDKAVEGASILLLIPYLAFTFPKFIVIKFFLLKVILWINKYKLNGKYKYLDILGLLGTNLLLINYHYAYQDGFVLSFFIPLLSLFYNETFHIKSNFVKKAGLLILISISFIPFSQKYYSEISIFSLPLQILFTPLFVILFILSGLSFLGIPLYNLIGNYSSFLSLVLSRLSNSLFKIYTPSISKTGIVIFELVLIIFLYYLSIGLKPIKNALLISLVGYLTFICVPINFVIKDYVSFINVGQGDSTLIKYKSSTILIDTGGNKYKDIATDVLIPYFKKKQIYHIDLLITTHDDFDHSGAAKSLVSNFTVNMYIKDYKSFPININGLTLTNYNVYPDLWNEENDKSLVIGFKLNSLNYLIMGDAPKKIEKEIIEDNEYIPCDILKVGHHGSKTSTSEEFVKFLNPTIGIISCGKNNMYGHPHSQVIAILNKYHVSIRRTDYESTITF